MRFTDEKKWSDKWFRSLKPCHKIVWIYICDNCDIAGFYEVDIESISFHTKLTEEESKGAIKGLSRGYLGADGHIWIKKFLKHQNNHLLNPSNNCHKGIIKRIQMNLNIFPDIPEILGANEGLFSPTSKSKSKGNSNVEVDIDIEKNDQSNVESISINPSDLRGVDAKSYHEYMKIYQTIKGYETIKLHNEIISAFREAAQTISEAQILTAVKDYKTYCEAMSEPVKFRKTVIKFLTEMGHKTNWILQCIDKDNWVTEAIGAEWGRREGLEEYQQYEWSN